MQGQPQRATHKLAAPRIKDEKEGRRSEEAKKVSRSGKGCVSDLGDPALSHRKPQNLFFILFIFWSLTFETNILKNINNLVTNHHRMLRSNR